MAKEVLIYGGINNMSASSFIQDVDSVGDEDLVVRINTPGGNPEAGFGMIAKLQERTGKTTVKIDGSAYSMGLFLATYVDEVEALDTSEFLLHRAAYPSWYEKDYMSEAERENLVRINSSLEKALKNSIDVNAFEEMKGVKLKDVFSMDYRKDVFLSAKEAKKIGLVSKIVKITPSKRTELNKAAALIAASNNIEPKFIPEFKENKQVVKPKIEKMTIEKLKADHPELVSAIVAERNDVVGSWLTYIDVDAKAVSEGIKSGNPMSQTAMAEFSLKMAQANTAKAIEGNAQPPVDGQVKDTQPELTDAQKMEAELMATLNLKNN